MAAEAVDAVVSNGRSLDAVLAGLDAAKLDDRDVSLVKALAYGTLRTHLRNHSNINAPHARTKPAVLHISHLFTLRV